MTECPLCFEDHELAACPLAVAAAERPAVDPFAPKICEEPGCEEPVRSDSSRAKYCGARCRSAAYLATPEGKAKKAAYSATPEGKAKRAAYSATPEGKAKRAAYLATPEWKAKKAAYNATPEAKAARVALQAAYRARKKAKLRNQTDPGSVQPS